MKLICSDSRNIRSEICQLNLMKAGKQNVTNKNKPMSEFTGSEMLFSGHNYGYLEKCFERAVKFCS